MKIRGFRIELGEIEAQLLALPQVREAVVVASQGAGGARLVAYVSPLAGERIEPARLRAGLAALLPEHMVPAAIVVLDTLPLNMSGKVDRHALPAPVFTGGDGYDAPRGTASRRSRASGPRCWAWHAWAATTISSNSAAIRC